VVTIKVGPEETKFYAHKSLLTEASTFFKAAVDGNFKEAAENEVKMPEESRDTFEHCVRWLYFGLPSDDTPPDDTSAVVAKIKQIVDSYVFGDKIGCPALKIDMVRAFYNLASFEKLAFPYASINYIYGAPIRVVPLSRFLRLAPGPRNNA
jgi:BTB/POZ domain